METLWNRKKVAGIVTVDVQGAFDGNRLLSDTSRNRDGPSKSPYG